MTVIMLWDATCILKLFYFFLKHFQFEFHILCRAIALVQTTGVVSISEVGVQKCVFCNMCSGLGIPHIMLF